MGNQTSNILGFESDHFIDNLQCVKAEITSQTLCGAICSLRNMTRSVKIDIISNGVLKDLPKNKASKQQQTTQTSKQTYNNKKPFWCFYINLSKKGGRRRGRQRKRWEDNIKEWTGLEWNIILRKAENREEGRKLVVKSIVVPQRSARLRDRSDKKI